MLFESPPNHNMNNNLPNTCRRGQGAGARHETDCMICTNPIHANTDTITHIACGRAICATCFFSWTRTAGPTATCPNCRAILEDPQPWEMDRDLYDDILQRAAESQANENAAFQIRLEAALAQRTAIDIATLVERFHAPQNDTEWRRDAWLAGRPNLIQELQAASVERQVVRRARLAEALKDQDDEAWSESWRDYRPGRRRTREEREDRAAREVRRSARGALLETELSSIFDAFNT